MRRFSEPLFSRRSASGSNQARTAGTSPRYLRIIGVIRVIRGFLQELFDRGWRGWTLIAELTGACIVIRAIRVIRDFPPEVIDRGWHGWTRIYETEPRGIIIRAIRVIRGSFPQKVYPQIAGDFRTDIFPRGGSFELLRRAPSVIRGEENWVLESAKSVDTLWFGKEGMLRESRRYHRQDVTGTLPHISGRAPAEWLRVGSCKRRAFG